MAEKLSTALALTKANPARGMTRESDVLTPLWQSLVWGFLVTLLAECGTFVFMDAGAGVNPRLMLYLALIVFPLVTLIAYAKSQRVAQATLWAYETARQEDLDGDGAIGKPTAHPFPVGSNPRPPLRGEDAWHSTAEWFILRCFRSGKNGEKSHVGKITGSGEKFTQIMYDEIRNILIAGWWARSKPGIRGGWEFVPGVTAAQIIAGLQKYREER